MSTCSLTKAYGLDGLRAGWIATTPARARAIRDLNDLYGIIMPHPSEQLALRAFEAIEPIRAWVTSFVEPNRMRLRRFVEESEQLQGVFPDHGPIAFVRLRGGDVDALVARLEERFDATAPAGRHFGAPDHLRLACGMAPEEMNAGLARLTAALDEVRVDGVPRGEA